MNENANTVTSVFSTLSKVDVSEHVCTKSNGRVNLSYLSWAWGWAYVKSKYPDATYRVRKSKAVINGVENELNYFTDGKTCWVEVEVTIQGVTAEMYLPVMDYKNQSITADMVTSFNVNTSIQRCLAKNIALNFGLGYMLYAGEDLPEDATEVADNNTTVAEPSTEPTQPVKKTVAKAKKPSMSLAQALNFEISGNNGSTTLKAYIENAKTEEKATQMMTYLEKHSRNADSLGEACSVLITALSKGLVKFG